eukprot:4192680-Prymnesium_polylepis.1
MASGGMTLRAAMSSKNSFSKCAVSLRNAACTSHGATPATPAAAAASQSAACASMISARVGFGAASTARAPSRAAA